jgi:hypothetical protein
MRTAAIASSEYPEARHRVICMSEPGGRAIPHSLGIVRTESKRRGSQSELARGIRRRHDGDGKSVVETLTLSFNFGRPRDPNFKNYGVLETPSN